MVSKKIDFPVQGGMQARPASEITNYFRNFEGVPQIIYKSRSANAKSIISLLSLGVNSGEEIEIKIESSNEEQDMDDFLKFLNELE